MYSLLAHTALRTQLSGKAHTLLLRGRPRSGGTDGAANAAAGDGIFATMNSIHFVVAAAESGSTGRIAAGVAAAPVTLSKESATWPFTDEGENTIVSLTASLPATAEVEIVAVGDAEGATATLTVKLGRLAGDGVMAEEIMGLGINGTTFEGRLAAADAGDDCVNNGVDDIAEGADVAVMTRPPVDEREDGDKEIGGGNELFPATTPFRS